MAGGVAIVGTASATIISYLNEKVAGLRHHGDTLAAAPTLSTAEEPDATPAADPAAASAALRPLTHPPRQALRPPTHPPPQEPTARIRLGPPGSLSG
jgi:hypothetical protein